MRPFVLIILAIQVIYAALGIALYKRMGGTFNSFKEMISVVGSDKKSGDELNWHTVRLPDAKITLSSPVDFKRNEDDKKLFTDNIAVSEAVCYKSDNLLMFSLDIQYIKFHIDITPEETLKWLIYKKHSFKNIEPKMTEIEIGGVKALQAAGEILGALDYRIIVIPETQNSVWIVNDANSYRVRDNFEQIIQKVTDSITIDGGEQASQ